MDEPKIMEALPFYIWIAHQENGSAKNNGSSFFSYGLLMRKMGWQRIMEALLVSL